MPRRFLPIVIAAAILIVVAFGLQIGLASIVCPKLAKNSVPAGSVSVSDGMTPMFSPDGRKLAFVREVIDPERIDIRENTVPRPDIWIRDLNEGIEQQFCLDTIPLGWASDSLIMTRRSLLDAPSGKEMSGCAKLPEKMGVKNVQWSRDGKELVYLPDVEFYRIHNMNQPNAGRALYIVDAAGATRSLPLGPSIDTDSNGFLAWSPDSKLIAFHLLFFRDGDVPIHRIGVVNAVSGVVHLVGEGAYCHQNWGLLRSEYSQSAPNPWDGASKRFLFVTGRGAGDADLYMATTDGSEAQRLTNDGCCKWSPLFDPSGHRAAYCSADWGGETGVLKNACVRVRDLATGNEQQIKPTMTSGMPLTLAWKPDGSGLVYDWQDGGKSQILETPLTAQQSVPDSAVKAISKETPKAQILDALASDKPAVVQWGAERAIQDPEIVAALRKALKNSLKQDASYPVREILDALLRLDARDSVPEVVDAFAVPYEPSRCKAIWLAAKWSAISAVEPLRAILKATPNGETAAHAAAALFAMGFDDGWLHVKRYQRIRTGSFEEQ